MCECGNKTKELVSFFNKETGLRKTVCNSCADSNGLSNNDKYLTEKYSNLTKEQEKTPHPKDAEY